MFNLPVTEIFSSIQGEGPYVGVKQIFFRLPKCNLSCAYCDTETKIPQECRIEIDPGSHHFTYVKNPIPLHKTIEIVEAFNMSIHHSLSITGGEPLLWSEELKVLLPLLKEKGIRIYLETNGTLPDQLRTVLPFVDFISMDIKLPYNGQAFWDEHESFLRYSLQKRVFVKVVVKREDSLPDLQKARDLIAGVNPTILTVLQPVTKKLDINPPEPYQLLQWQTFFLEKLNNVRVIPQTHVYLGQL